MNGVLAPRPGELGIADIVEPRPADDQAVIEVRYIGVCGSDMHAYKGTHPFVTYPRVLGHEISGILAAVPRDASLLRSGICVGDPVIVEPYINCGVCHMCQAGRPNACLQLKVLGVHIDGAMTRYIAVRADKILRIPDGLSLRDAALAEPLGIGFHAVNRGRIQKGQTVFVIGSGTIGRAVLAGARQAGARVAISELIEQRIDAARRLGAGLALNAADSAAMQTALLDWTAGKGPDVVIEAVGIPETIQQSFDIVRPGGAVVLVGMSNLPVPLLTKPIMAKELNVCASRNSTAVLDKILCTLAARRIDVDSFVSHEIPLADAPRIIPDMCENPYQYLKVLVTT